MTHWLLRNRWCMLLILVAYLSLHVMLRWVISPVLDFDESEQVFLSQWLAPGYNNQPPMYTWVQMGVFQVFGTSIVSLTVLKNLFLFGTYVLAYATIRTATTDPRPAIVASAGMLTIPQIAWESHRDLSHTVGATFFAALLFYAIARLAERPAWRWYGLIGVAAGLGMLSKYNFSLLVLGVLTAAMSLPTYRQLLLDRRIWFTAAVAACLFTPHAVWMAEHFGLASSRTIATMAQHATGGWLGNVMRGSYELVCSATGCLTFTVVLFAVVRHAGRSNPGEPTRGEMLPLGHLLERTLITIAVLLVLIIVSGQASEFKNRWIQPFVIVVPGYLALKWRSLWQTRAVNQILRTGGVVMASVLVAIVARPLLSKDGPKPNQLNLDFEELVAALGTPPELIVASDMRVAGNLRLQLPGTRVLSLDHPHLGSLDQPRESPFLVVSDRPTARLPVAKTRLIGNSGETDSELAHPSESLPELSIAWETIAVPYLHRPDGREPAVFHVGYAPPTGRNQSRGNF